jgi:hypothetical protein
MADSGVDANDEHALSPAIGDLIGRVMRRFVQRGRDELDRAARTGRERLELRQLRRDLDHFWVRLGKTSYHLVHAGELDHPALRKAMARIDDLEARIDRMVGAVHEESAEE